MKNNVKGLLLLVVLLFATLGIHSVIPASIQIEKLTVGIVLGLAISVLFGLKAEFKPGAKFALHHFLNLGIILLGFKLNYVSLVQLGPALLVMVAVYVPVVLIFAVALGRAFGVPVRIATLIGVGSSICGASASAAMAPLIGAEEEETLISVAVISVLGAVGVLFFTGLSAVVDLSNVRYGLWSGLSLQGVGHALAAAFARGEEAGQMGTLVKMARVLMLVPMSLLLPLAYHKKTDAKRVRFPRYVLYFLIAGALGTLGLVPDQLLSILNQASNTLILVAMIAMGLLVDIKSIRNKGIRPIVLGIAVFASISAANFLVIQWFPLP